MSSMTLDIILISFLLILAIFGYFRGFITRLYDFISLLVVLYISFAFSKPLSHMINLYPDMPESMALQMTSQILNHIIVFVVLFVVLFIAKKIIGFLIKPLLKGLVHKFSLTQFADQTLGLVLGVVEGFILSYIAIIFMMTPLFPSANLLVKDSQVASIYMTIVPQIGDNVIEMSEGLKDLELNHSSNESFMKVMLAAYEMGFIDNEQVSSFIENYLINELQSENVSLTGEEYNQFKDIMQNIDYNNDEIKKILSKINVSDE